MMAPSYPQELAAAGATYRSRQASADAALTRVQDLCRAARADGHTVTDIAAWSGLSRQAVARAIRSGAMRARRER